MLVIGDSRCLQRYFRQFFMPENKVLKKYEKNQKKLEKGIDK